MKTNRRNVLALTAAGIGAVLTGSAAAAPASRMAKLGERFERAHARFDSMVANRNRAEAAFQDQFGSLGPQWDAPNILQLGYPSLRRSLHSVEHALELFNALIADKAALGTAARVGLINQLKAAREMAVEALIEQEAAYAPVDAWQAKSDRAGAIAARCLDALIAEPCRTLDDVRTKAAYLARRDADCWAFTGEEVASLLGSFVEA